MAPARKAAPALTAAQEAAVRQATDGPWWAGFHAGLTELRGRVASARAASADLAPAPAVGAEAAAQLSSAVSAIVQRDAPPGRESASRGLPQGDTDGPREPEPGTHEHKALAELRSQLRNSLGYTVVLGEQDARTAVRDAERTPPREPFVVEDEGSRIDVEYANPLAAAAESARQTVVKGADAQLASLDERTETLRTAWTALSAQAAHGLSPTTRLAADGNLGLIKAHMRGLEIHLRDEVQTGARDNRGLEQAKDLAK